MNIDKFKSTFRDALISIFKQPNLKDIDRFINGECTLQEIGVCFSITAYLDKIIEQTYPTYDGCLDTDTIDKIIHYNEEFIE